MILAAVPLARVALADPHLARRGRRIDAQIMVRIRVPVLDQDRILITGDAVGITGDVPLQVIRDQVKL
jgi:hypothetical protein